MVLTRRRWPHLYLGNTPLFLTWHLYGSLPHKLYPPPGKQNSGKAFVWMDRYLDSARTGPVFLRQEAIARLLVESIRYNAEQLRYFDLQAFAIMPNHVHLLALPRVSPSRFMQTLKGYTARQANQLLQRAGQPFWQTESYDHSVRDLLEGQRIRAYIENNPVKAVVERQSAVESRDDSRLSKPDGLRHARLLAEGQLAFGIDQQPGERTTERQTGGHQKRCGPSVVSGDQRGERSGDDAAELASHVHDAGYRPG
jgi:REP element-mobilizing transposase RayT